MAGRVLVRVYVSYGGGGLSRRNGRGEVDDEGTTGWCQGEGDAVRSGGGNLRVGAYGVDDEVVSTSSYIILHALITPSSLW
jgi:hypothetical protein